MNVGEDKIIPASVRLTISCRHLINTLVPFNITWTRNGMIATNIPNLILNQDRHLLILEETTISVGGQFGNGGTYACTVCYDNGTCIERQSHVNICGKPVNMLVNDLMDFIT